jgi:predicted kinase
VRPVRLVLPGRSLLLVAGMPGAGKSTLLARLPARPDVVVLDSDAQRAALRPLDRRAAARGVRLATEEAVRAA